MIDPLGQVGPRAFPTWKKHVKQYPLRNRGTIKLAIQLTLWKTRKIEQTDLSHLGIGTRYGDIQSTSHDSGTYLTEESLQKKTRNESQIPKNLKDHTNYTDMQPKIQNQPWGKKGNDTTSSMTSSELEILLNTAGIMGDKINKSADATPLGPEEKVHSQTRSKSRTYNDMISKLKTHKEERRCVSDISCRNQTETK